jgi:phosphoenolpyruvate---glycerone phosphotransferase subunit DhaL
VTTPLGLGLLAVAAALRDAADDLKRLDGFAGDGDLGITMTEVANALDELVATGEGKATDALLLEGGGAIARRAPSTSGTLVATGFLRAGKAFAADEGAAASPTALMAAMMEAALTGVKARGKAEVGDRTLVDGLDAVCRSLEASAAQGQDWPAALAAAAGAAQAAAEATTALEPKLGRASWVPERARGHPDAGCTALAVALAAAAAAVP